MSNAEISDGVSIREQIDERLDAVPLTRVCALAGAAGLLASFLFVLYEVVDTAGEPLLFYPVIILPLVAATVLARTVRVVVALAIGAMLFVGGIGWHVLTLSAELDLALIVDNNIELLTGRTVIAIRQADIWALAVTPMPVLVTWFLALRRWYLGAATVGGSMLGYLVLTGDAGTTVTLLGVVSGAALIAFGEIDTDSWSDTADQTAIVLAAMVIAPFLLTIVPGGAASPVTFLDSQSSTMEDNVVTSDASIDILGSIEQSSDVRFTIESDEPHLWQTNSFDRYTGDGWVRSGDADAYTGELDSPPGETERLTQRVTAKSQIQVLPAAWKAVAVDDGIADSTQVTSTDGLVPEAPFAEGATFTVTSAVAKPSAETLKSAGRDYPQEILDTYTQLPASTPSRVTDRTAQIVQNADNPYESARVIERWLKENREYSLDVDKPDGNIADAFLFKMDRGYCTYYATTMITMLRTQDIPARMVTGYTTGEQIDNDTYQVRGLNSHAWVEVYFPDVGWIAFDPTPPDPREQAQQAALEQDGISAGGASAGSAQSTPTGDTTPIEPVRTPASGEAPLPDEPAQQIENPQDVGPDGTPNDQGRIPGREGGDGGGSGGFTVPVPSGRQLVFGTIALFGLVAGVRQSKIVGRLSRGLRIRFQRRSDPATDIERAYERLMLILESRHRPRKTGETMRTYLAAINASDEARRLVELRERSRYADTVSAEAADEAIALIDEIRTQD